MNLNNPKISVVVCTYNRAHKVTKCLQALYRQTLATNEYEVIVVNDGSTDETARVLEGYDFKIINNNPNQGLAQSRNIGVSASRANTIAFTDDDCVPDKNWLKNLLKAYTDPNIVAVGGKIIPYKVNKWLLKYYKANNPLNHLTFSFDNSSKIFYVVKQYIKRSFSLRHLPDKAVRLYMITGANMSMRRWVFDVNRGFDPAIKFGGEEEDFWNRFRKSQPNRILIYAPDVIVRHDFDPHFKDAIKRNFNYGIGEARMYLKNNGVPVIYPFPIIVIISLALALINPYYILISLLLTLILYPGWLLLAVRKNEPKYIQYAFIQMFLELVNSYGFIRGCLKLRSIYSKKHREGSAL